MMKIYICPQCGWMRVVSRRKSVECHKCDNLQMRLTNLTMERYARMEEGERQDYAEGWLFIHRREGSRNG